MNCKGCIAIDKPFWGDCDVKICCEAKGYDYCGQCSDFPCGTLTEMSYAEEEGDNGKRIDTCCMWARAQKAKPFSIEKFLSDVWTQNADALKTYFTPNAQIYWHETNEQFTVEEYIKASCEYPGVWENTIQRIDEISDGVVIVFRTSSAEAEFLATVFIKFDGNKISRMDEYYCMCGTAPEWRQEMKIGKPIIEGKTHTQEGW